MDRSNLSLKWLEVFQAVARGGSIQAAAQSLSISISTASHHLGCLEREAGVPLVDHSRRPMRLTPQGAALLRRTDEALGLLRQGMADVWSRDPGTLVRRLRIAMVEDLDGEVTPALAARLATDLRACDLDFLSRPSHDILTLLQSEEIDMGVASAAEFDTTRLVERPLLRDPYVVVVPRDGGGDAGALIRGEDGLPFLRYSKRQLIGRRIEAQLRRMRVELPSRQSFESTRTILGLVARGQGWTITTALNYASARAVQAEIAVLPVPAAGFVRELSLFHGEGLPEAVARYVDRAIRPPLTSGLIAPTLDRVPWLKADLRFLGGAD